MEHAATTLQVETPHTARDADWVHERTPIHSERDLKARARQAIKADRRIDAIFLFGSRARGTARPNSDWDVAIVSTNDRVPTLGSNVDTTPIDSKTLQRGITTGSIEAVVVKYGRIIARTKGWNTIGIKEVPPKPFDVLDQFAYIVRCITTAACAMTAGSGREHQLGESEWKTAMAAGTQAASEAAKLLAKEISTALGITPGYGHGVDKIAQSIREATKNKDVTKIAQRIDALNGYTREAHNVAYVKYPAEPETVWGLRVERTMQVTAELIEGVRDGEGPFAVLKTLPDAAPLREKLRDIEAEVISQVNEVSTGRSWRVAGTAARRTLATLTRIVKQQGHSSELEPERDPFGRQAAQTVREASALCNATVLKRARIEGVTTENTLVRGDPDTWEKGRNATEILAGHENSHRRTLTAHALGNLPTG